MMWGIGAVALIIIVIIIVVVNNNAGNVDMTAYPTGQHSTGTIPDTGTTATGTTGTGAAANLSYNDALKKYGTNRIQFNAACQTTPSSVTYKSGTQVMFDNRSAGTHTITFNGTKHTIAGYGYAIIGMFAAKYPTTVLVDCDKSQNVATVLIQK